MNNIIEIKNLFKGKCVSFSFEDEILAVNVEEIKSLNGKVFVLGRIAQGSTKNDWAMHTSCGVSWEEVSDFMIFETEEEYTVAMKNSE